MKLKLIELNENQVKTLIKMCINDQNPEQDISMFDWLEELRKDFDKGKFKIELPTILEDPEDVCDLLGINSNPSTQTTIPTVSEDSP